MGASANPVGTAAGQPARAPIEGPFAWNGRELEKTDSWVRRFTPAEVDEVDAALALVRRRGLAMADIGPADFPLPTLAGRLAAICEELERGTGIVVLRGLPAERWSEEDQRLILWGIGTISATPCRRARPAAS